MQGNEFASSVARPASAQLRAFADRLSSLHPADIRHILWAIAEFGYQFYPVIDPGAPAEFADQLHEATDSAHTLGVVFRQVSEFGFQEFMGDVAKVFDLAIGHFTSSYNDENHDAYLVLIQLRHLRSSLVYAGAAAPAAQHFDREASSHLAIVAGICVAALIWVLVSDHMPLWQLLAALLLVGAFGGLAFRLGKKAATGLETSLT
ncbi:MAG TPA: hypothetical protein VKH81_14945 [Candidatus Angelobacter sp.]|nr:hypothetical protein [Candidatus Angelobacter sp.]